MKITLENYLRNKLDEVESVHSFELATDTIRCWIDEYNDQLRHYNVSGSFLSDDEIRDAADEWVFEINGMKWSINDDTAGDNFGSFIAGAKWVLSRLSNVPSIM